MNLSITLCLSLGIWHDGQSQGMSAGNKQQATADGIRHRSNSISYVPMSEKDLNQLFPAVQLDDMREIHCKVTHAHPFIYTGSMTLFFEVKINLTFA